MRTTSKKLILSLASALYILVSGTPLYADDIEIFTGLNPNTISAQPNILFIIDTSGSMDGTVHLTKAVYDPATTYPNTNNCIANSYYWSNNGNAPDCNTSDQYVTPGSFKCDDASSALGASGSGYYNGRFARYTSPVSGTDYWTTLLSAVHSENVECAADYGNDGDGVDTLNLYPANQVNSGPWRANITTAINWASTGDAYTIYTTNYINYLNTSGTDTHLTRLQVVQHVLTNMIDSTANINASLMQFDATIHASNVPHSLGGSFVEPMQEIDSNSRAGFKASIDGLTAYGKTPLAETLYEAMLYYRGEHVNFGDTALPVNVNSVLDPSDASRYKSPIEFQCQKNFVVLLTDGDPVADNDADTLINKGNPDNFPGIAPTPQPSSCGYSANDCLDELAEYMFNNDQTTALQGDQNIITYTIGFGNGIGNPELLKETATKGGSTGGIDGVGYFTADSVTSLANAFTSIITEINRVNTTFVSPAVSVNAFNRLTNSDELYFALFLPTEKYRWPGNLKKYKLAREITGDPESDLIIVDVAGNSAIDVATGFFKDTAQSFWSSAADGPDVKLGGAAENLPTTTRNLYTFTGANSDIAAPQTGTPVELNNVSNKLHEDNTVLVAAGTTEDATANALFGLAANTSDADRTTLIQWARGVDVMDENTDGSTTDYRQAMGDPLHSQPQLVSYKGTDETDIDTTIYITTNQGYLHAINVNDGNPNTTDGNELFAFIPKELLPNLTVLKNNSSTAMRTYGLDGPMTIWHNDLNRDRLVLNADDSVQVTKGASEHVYLYFGMRRGGKSYYAMDVTTRSSPKLKWKIEGGIPGDDFEELGQSWSKMTHAKIKFANAEKNVLIFGGGYDTNEDNITTPADDNMGRAIFIVDAETGQRLWWASIAGSGADKELAEMKNSIVADVTAFDSDSDGFVDRLYAADLAARIWRFDLSSTATDMAVTGGLIADLNGTALNDPNLDLQANNRRFYYEPSVAYVRESAKEYLTIAVGSGLRAHPLDTMIDDRFYVIRDTNVREPAKDANGNAIYTSITENDLYDTTLNIIGESSGSQLDAARASLNTNNGWYIKLNEPDGSFIGEKIISRAMTFNGILIFSSFTPITNQVNSCTGQGISAAWAINLLDGQPVFNFDTSNPDMNRADRKATLALQGLPPDTSIIITGGDLGGDVTAVLGTVILKDNGLLDDGDAFQVDYWNVR